MCVPVALFSYFYSQQEVSGQAHKARVALLIEAKSLDAKLDTAVLQMLSAQLNQYDSLAQLTHAVEQLTRPGAEALFNNTPSAIQQQFSHYLQLLQQKSEQIESIKTAAANIRNSVLYLPELIAELEQISPEHAELANKLNSADAE